MSGSQSSTTKRGITTRGETGRPARDSRTEQAAAKLSLLSNIVLVVLKILAGLASGSVSVLAEGVQSTIDVLASALILVTIRASAAPPDPDHPWGHGKFENVASLGQMLLILATGAYLYSEAWRRWWHPEPLRVDWGVAALSLSLLVNFLVSRRLLRVSRETGSQALHAEAQHLRGDMLSCAGILGGLLLVAATGNQQLDPLFAGVMTTVVVFTALKLMRDSLRPLLDESLPADEEEAVRAVLDADPLVWGYHRLRTRRAGSDRLLDVHILLDDDLSFREAHSVTEDVEAELRMALPNVDIIIHAEPFEEEMRHQLERHGTLLPTQRPTSCLKLPNPPGAG